MMRISWKLNQFCCQPRRTKHLSWQSGHSLWQDLRGFPNARCLGWYSLSNYNLMISCAWYRHIILQRFMIRNHQTCLVVSSQRLCGETWKTPSPVPAFTRPARPRMRWTTWGASHHWTRWVTPRLYRGPGGPDVGKNGLEYPGINGKCRIPRQCDVSTLWKFVI